MNLTAIVWEGVDCIHLAQDEGHCGLWWTW